VRLPEIIENLIKDGANVDHADDEGRTPLHLAVMENRLPLVQYLIEKKADIYVRIEKYTVVA
jgi:ankyrin repeat protein